MLHRTVRVDSDTGVGLEPNQPRVGLSTNPCTKSATAKGWSTPQRESDVATVVRRFAQAGERSAADSAHSEDIGLGGQLCMPCRS